MKERMELKMTDSLTAVCIVMAEGNPGALKVLSEIVKEKGIDAFMSILHLDDMNIRGAQIWLAYKDYCGQDLERLLEAAEARDPEMVAKINAEMSYDPDYPQAVTGGASKPGERSQPAHDTPTSRPFIRM